MLRAPRRIASLTLTLFLTAGVFGCGQDEVSSDEQARRAYLGLDNSIQKSLQLGFAGFNAASSANIPAQLIGGDASGTLTITGQVDQGASANKGMRLRVGMREYSDGKVVLAEDGKTTEVDITYQTDTEPTQQPALNLSLRNIPNGTFTGTLVGPFQMSGDIKGEVTLDLAMSGEIEDDGTGKVRRKAGSTTVTGTAKAGGGEYKVDLKL
jgi:hypothetical protein